MTEREPHLRNSDGEIGVATTFGPRTPVGKCRVS
jgi:hypothetical protein